MRVAQARQVRDQRRNRSARADDQTARDEHQPLEHGMTLWRLAATLPILVALAASPAYAQTADDDGEAGTTIVQTRAPKEKRNLLVRNKFFVKGGRLELAPAVGFITNNPLNNEITAGAWITYHFTDRIGLELGAHYGIPGGASNGKPLAKAVLRLLDPDEKIESVDPGLLASASVIWSPMYGKINPAGMFVINLDFFFAAGIGYHFEMIEMLGLVNQGLPNEALGLGTPATVNHLLQLNLGAGTKIFVTKWFAIRADFRLYASIDKVLDYDTPEAASENRALGNDASRLSCDQAGSQAFCKWTFPTTILANFSGSFFLPGDKAARARQTRRR
jgi:outer membrane beta-barrel protein